MYYYRLGRAQKIRLPDDYGSPTFWAAYEDAEKSQHPQPPKLPDFSTDKGRKRRALSATVDLLEGAKRRARRLGRDFDLDLHWIEQRIVAQKFRCDLCGIPFFALDPEGMRINPYAPSIDRIDSTGGYTRDNTRIVLFAVNIMLNQWGDALFDRIVGCYRAHKRTKRKTYSHPCKRNSPNPTAKSLI
jgi:hypothetical protein